MPRGCYIRTEDFRKRESEKRSGEKHFNYGKCFSEETRRKISASQKGRIQSEETKRKISIANTGRLLGDKHHMFGKHYSDETRRKMSEAAKNKPPMTNDTRRKMSEVRRGKHPTKETRKKLSGENNHFYGKTHSINARKKISIANSNPSEETRRKMSAARATKIGEKSSNWKGGVTPLHLQIRTSIKYSRWRNTIFKRDNYCDWFSGIKGNGNLNVHHVVPFNSLLEKYNIKTFQDALKCNALWDINNGVTMIETSHLAYHTMWGIPNGENT